MRKCAVIHWQCLPQARVVTWVPDTFYPCRDGTVSVTKWSVILFEDLPGFGRRHLPLWFSHTLLFVLFPLREAPAPIPKKEKVTTTLCTKFLLFSLSLILFHESESFLHTHQQSELKLLFSTALLLFIFLRPAFCLIQKPLEDGEGHSSLLSDKDFLLKCIFSSTSKSSGNTETSTHQGLYTYRNTSTHSSNTGLYQE